MAFTVGVRNVSPTGAVRVHLDGDTIEVRKDQVVQVAPETAGKAPRWRRAELDDDGMPTEPVHQMHARVRAGHLEVFDLGEGLLAQTENWRKDGEEADPADPQDDGGGQLVDIQQFAGGLTASAIVSAAGPEIIDSDPPPVPDGTNTGQENG